MDGPHDPGGRAGREHRGCVVSNDRAEGWWRRNRWGLAALPLALVLAVAGNAARVGPMWWDLAPHVARGPGADGLAQVRSPMPAWGGTVVDARLGLVGVQRTTTVTDRSGRAVDARVPAGTVLWRVTLRVEAEPAVPLVGCELALVDARGRSFSLDRGAITPSDAVPRQRCVPDATPGPEWDSTTGGLRTDVARAAAYQVVSYVVTPADVQPTEIRVWWQLPEYAALPAPQAR